MIKTIKVIDLLVKVANREEVPEKIKFDGVIFTFNNGYYYAPNTIYTLKDFLSLGEIKLNAEVEIIEDKEDINIQDIEELTYKGEKIGYGSTEQFTDDVDDYCRTINSILDSVEIKINEIIRAVKHLEKTKEDK